LARLRDGAAAETVYAEISIFIDQTMHHYEECMADKWAGREGGVSVRHSAQPTANGRI
jgi:hypothetical protein